MDLVKDGRFSNMHAYFEKYLTAIDVSNRSTKSLDFSKSLKELTQEEIKALMDSMVSEVGPNGRVGSTCVQRG